MGTDEQKALPVSVIICAYNAEKYLERSLRSICTQTYGNLEILVVDDASTDGTLSIVNALAKKDDRIRCIHLEQNGGIAHARQVGLENSRHDWLMFLDADDVALPHMIARQVSMLEQDENLIAVGSYAYYISDNESNYLGVQEIGPTSKEMFCDFFSQDKLIFLPITTLCRKSYIYKAGGFRLYGFQSGSAVRYQDYCEDLDLWCRMADFGAEGKYLVTIPEPLFLYRKTAGSLSTTNVFHMQGKMRWIKDCLKRRRAGLAERDFEEYRQSFSLLARVDNLRKDYAAFVYKAMGFRYLRRQYLPCIFLLAAVCVLNPRLVLQKFKTQKLQAGTR